MSADYDRLYKNPAEYDRNHQGLVDDIPFFVDLAKKAKGATLEVCCGSGRLTLPIAKAGIEISGLDSSPQMLAAARRKARAENIKAKWVQADMRYFDLKRRFPLIFVGFHSIHHLQDPISFALFLKCIDKHLTPTGDLVIDSQNPVLLAQKKGHKKPPSRELSSFNRLDWYGSRPSLQRLSYLYPCEFETVLNQSGFMITEIYGHFDRSPYSMTSPRLILFCKKRDFVE